MLVRLNQHIDIDDYHDRTKHEISVNRKTSDLAVLFLSVIQRNKADCCKKSALPDSIEKPPPKLTTREVNIIESNPVCAIIIQEVLFVVLPVKNREPNYR